MPETFFAGRSLRRAALFASALALLAGVGASGCGRGGGFDDPATVAEVERLVLEQAPEAAGALRRGADGPLGPVQVYVDLSLSMRPYLSPTADASGGEAPAFRRLLEALDNSLGADVSFFGFGFEPDSAAQTVTPASVARLVQPASYGRLNNDYGALFSGFAPDSTGSGGAAADLGPTRVVITDGVESDPEGGPRFGRVVAAADRWVRAGGVFAVVVYRAPYAGTYYTEGAACPRGRLALSCPDRPLVAFVFAPTDAQVSRLVASVDVKPVHTVRVGSRDARLVPVESVTREGERRPTSILRSVREAVAPGFEAVSVVQVNNRSADAQGFVPLTFEVALDAEAEPWRSLSADERQAFVKTLRPRLRTFAVNSRRDSVSLTEVDADVYRPTVTVDSAGVARVTVPVKRPDVAGVRTFAFLLSLVPYESAQTLVPDGLSTVSDCAAETCGQTLNLAPLLGAILRDDYVPARTLLLAEWRP